MCHTLLHRSSNVVGALVVFVQLACVESPFGADGDPSSGPPPAPPVGFIRFVSISAGNSSVCGLTADGATYCWGAPEPAYYSVAATSVPTRVPNAPTFTAISVAPSAVNVIDQDLLCGLGGDGRAHCRGGAGGAFVAVPRPADSAAFTKLASGMPVCATTAAGDASCWSYGFLVGVLGNGTHDGYSLTPVRVAGGITFVSLSATTGRSCGLSSAGGAFCWGYNTFWSIGDGILDDLIRYSPSAVAGGHQFREIFAGPLHTCALTLDGKPYCWGLAEYGEIGNTAAPTVACSDFGGPSGPTCVATPVLVAGDRSFSTLALGLFHTCGLAVGGEAYCWGSGAWGQLGDRRSGTERKRLEPFPVAGGLTFRAIAAGFRFTCAIATNDATYCWGGDQVGELGSGLPPGTIIARPQPISVANH